MKLVLVLLVCVVGANANDVVYGTLKVLLGHAWDAFKTFMKRPRRSSRVQENAKASKKEIDLPINVKPTNTLPEANVQDTINPDMLYYFQRPRHKQILIPIIPMPTWRSGEEWSENDQPNDFVMRREDDGVHQTRSTFAFSEKIGDLTATSKLDESTDEGIGVMMFI